MRRRAPGSRSPVLHASLAGCNPACDPWRWRRAMKSVFGLGVAWLVLWAPAAASDSPRGARLLRGPYLQAATGESMVIVWRTIGPLDQPVVRFGKGPSNLDRRSSGSAIVVQEKLQKGIGGFAADDVLDPATRQYEAHLTGLEPLTTYYYAVYDGERMLAGGDESFRFQTYPKLGQPARVRFSACGDSHGPGWQGEAEGGNVELALQRLCDQQQRPCHLLLLLGDFANKGRNKEFQYMFEPGDLVRRRQVIWPTIGNHDIVSSDAEGRITGPYADTFVLPIHGEAGGAPSGSKAYYSFNYGRVHFVAMASFFVSREPDGPMAKWLAADLAKARADGHSDWIVAFFHSPPLTATGPANMSDRERDQVETRAYLLPILEQGGTDLILSGHMHAYVRSKLCDGVYQTPIVGQSRVLDDGDGDPRGDGPYRKSAGLNPHEGLVGVIVGTGGGPGQEGVYPVGKRFSLDGGMLVVDIEGDTLSASFMRRDGTIGDRFSIVKRGTVVPWRIANPKQDVAVYYRRKLPGMRYAVVPLVEGRPMLDGQLEDPIWTNACTIRNQRWVAHVLGTAEALYAGVDVASGTSDMRIHETDRDGRRMALDLLVELYVDPRRDFQDVYEFTCNPAGVQRDARNGDTAYNAEWQVKTQVAPAGRKEHWIAEMRVPWKALGLDGPPGPDAILGMNLRASRTGTGPEWFPGRGDPRFLALVRPEHFGCVRFGAGCADPLIAPYAEWKYLAGQDPADTWTQPDFNDSDWKSGPAGFGYGDIENGTPLLDMKGRYTRVYARKSFEVSDPKALSDLALLITRDDAFIAYLNGQEVLRVGVEQGRGPSAKGIAVHEGTGPEYPPDQPINRYTPLAGFPAHLECFSLKPHLGLLRNGVNVLAVEGHNASPTSKAFTLDPHLMGTRRTAP